MNRKLAMVIAVPYLISLLLYVSTGIFIYFVKAGDYPFPGIYSSRFIFEIVLFPYPVFLGPVTFLSLVASLGFVIKLKLNKAIILGLVGSSLMGFFLIGYFIAFSTVDLVIYLYFHLVLWIIICLINLLLIIFRLKPSRNDIKIVRRTVLEFGVQFSILQVKEISEKCKIDDKTVLRVIKLMIRNHEVYGKYYSKHKLILFDYNENNLNIEKLIDTFNSYN